MADNINHPLETTVTQFLSDWTIEVTPGGTKRVDDFRNHLKVGTDVYITHLPGSNFEEVIATAIRLRSEGMNPVPHIAARSIPNELWLKLNLEIMKNQCGLNHVLLIGGDIDNPVGEFADTMQILDTGLFERFEIYNIGVAGHPEGSPDISEEEIQNALRWKNVYAKKTGSNLCITTQFVFEAKPVIDWERRIRMDGNELPIRIGIPGIATIKTLLSYARACGIGPSARFLTKQARNIGKLMQFSSPEGLILDLSSQCLNQDSLISGVHVYPVGGLKRSAAWFCAVSNGDFTINHDQKRIAL
jgi:methylenetetrahydrofolate reductase (NADPH)